MSLKSKAKKSSVETYRRQHCSPYSLTFLPYPPHASSAPLASATHSESTHRRRHPGVVNPSQAPTNRLGAHPRGIPRLGEHLEARIMEHHCRSVARAMEGTGLWREWFVLLLRKFSSQEAGGACPSSEGKKCWSKSRIGGEQNSTRAGSALLVMTKFGGYQDDKGRLIKCFIAHREGRNAYRWYNKSGPP